eukprot:15177686-Alexandrium_andersonii.AAC.1
MPAAARSAARRLSAATPWPMRWAIGSMRSWACRCCSSRTCRDGRAEMSALGWTLSSAPPRARTPTWTSLWSSQSPRTR